MKFNTMSEGWAVACMGVKPGRRGLQHQIDEMHFLSPPTSARLLSSSQPGADSRKRQQLLQLNTENSFRKVFSVSCFTSYAKAP